MAHNKLSHLYVSENCLFTYANSIPTKIKFCYNIFLVKIPSDDRERVALLKNIDHNLQEIDWLSD